METAGKTSDPTYQVIGWQENFEGAKSKCYNHKTSCQMPTKHGLGYRRLVMHQDGASLFGAWCAMIQVLSRHGNPRDGYCTVDGTAGGKPYNPVDMEILTGIKSRYFYTLFQVATGQDVGWLRILQGYHADTTRIPDGYHADTSVPSDSDSDSDSDLNSDTDSKACACVENSVTSRDSNVTDTLLSASVSASDPEGGCKGGKFQKPTAEQVTEYGKSIGFDIDGNEFVDFYTSKGWLIGKNPMKDWQASVRTWKRKSATNPTAKPKFPKLQSHDMMSMTREQQDEYYRTGVKHYACELKPQVEQ